MYTELTDDSLQELLKSNGKTIVQYSAGWCGNCRMMKPKFKSLADQHEDVQFVLVDAEKFPNSRKLANVNNLPTFAAFDGEEFINQIQTNRPKNLEDFTNEITSN